MSAAKDNNVVTECKRKRAFIIFFSHFSLFTLSILGLSRLILCKIKCKFLDPFNIEMITFHVSMNLFVEEPLQNALFNDQDENEEKRIKTR